MISFLCLELKYASLVFKIIKENAQFKCSKQKGNLFQCNLDYKHLFINNKQKNVYANHIRQLYIGKDRLISVKYRLNFTKVENLVNRYYPILTDISNTN